MVKNLIESIAVFIGIALIPSIIMMMSGSVGPFMVLIGLMFTEYFLVKRV